MLYIYIHVHIAKATFGDKEWYFFSPRERKYPNGVRPNRAAGSGYWKATGTDKKIVSGKENVGVKKALVFYQGKPPKGHKTNWIMHEYRLSQPIKLGDWVLCRIYKKSSHLWDLEQEGSSVEDIHTSNPKNNKQVNTLKAEKSISLSDLLNEADYSTLSQLFDMDQSMNMVQTSVNCQPLVYESTGGQSNTETGCSVLKEEKSLKRQRPVHFYSEEEIDDILIPSKKSNSSNNSYFSNQFYSPQCNLLNQHLLLNPQLRLQ